MFCDAQHSQILMKNVAFYTILRYSLTVDIKSVPFTSWISQKKVSSSRQEMRRLQYFLLHQVERVGWWQIGLSFAAGPSTRHTCNNTFRRIRQQFREKSYSAKCDRPSSKKKSFVNCITSHSSTSNKSHDSTFDWKHYMLLSALQKDVKKW